MLAAICWCISHCAFFGQICELISSLRKCMWKLDCKRERLVEDRKGGKKVRLIGIFMQRTE